MNLRTRFAVLERDGWRCRYCGAVPSRSAGGLQVDHVAPVSRGGGDERENLVTSCRRCNLGKFNTVLRRPPPLTESERYEQWIEGWEACSEAVMGRLLWSFGYDPAPPVLEAVAARFGEDADTAMRLFSGGGQSVIAWAGLEPDDPDAAAVRAVVEWLLARAAERYIADQKSRAEASTDGEAP
jgi:hypothetical protein